MANSDGALKEFVSAIISGDADGVSRQLAASPELARAQVVMREWTVQR